MSANAAALPAAPAGPVAAYGKWAIAFSVALGALLEIVDTSIVNVALTDMATSLDATVGETSWIVSSYAVANVIILPLSAWLGKRFGQKRYFIFSLVGFTLASAACGFATSLPMLIIARVAQGLAGGGLLAKAQSILFQTFPREQQAMAQAFFGIVVISGPAIGPTLGGYLVTNIGWRWIFFVNLPIGLLAIFMTWLTLPKDKIVKGLKEGVDYLGILFLAIGLGCLETFLEEGNRNDWFESTEITVLAASALFGLIFFVWRELTTEHPAVDLRVLKYRSLWAGSIVSVVLGVALYGALFVIPIFSQQVMGMTSQQVGLMLLPSALAAGAMMPVMGFLLSKKLDPRLGLTIGCLILGSTLYALVPLTPQTGEDDFFWPLLIRGAGMVFMFLPLTMAALGPIPKEDIANASGFFNLTRQMGGSIGVALLSTVLTNRVAFHHANIAEHLVSTDPNVIGRLDQLTHFFQAKGMALVDAHHAALTALQGSVMRQASVMSFADIFWLVAVAVFCMIPLTWILGRPPKGGGLGMAGAH
ncbi:MAG: DHA2 family efflux MFS transporter permease subunit [Myxococcales bacterium]|nr:DHA2 family efflux MFS transporter permease subunit [Myxococcales bacterium]MCB9735936.1 DHA2 family efflux MFS transporter permease subunit [Deltaproteobacteria bacterium]